MSKNFSYTKTIETYTFQPGATYQFYLWGANGGSYSSSYSTGGVGGYSYGTWTNPFASTITGYIYVGGKGGYAGSDGGWSGAGWTYDYGGSGGAESTIMMGASSDDKKRIIVAGGGGGGGYKATLGGNGGGLEGSAGGPGTLTAGGKGGTQTAGGAKGTTQSSGVPGRFGGADYSSGYGGGGGGGWYGGASGQTAGSSSSVLDSGGGGGSGYLHKNSNSMNTLGASYILSDAATLSPTEPGFVANPKTSGYGFVAIIAVPGTLTPGRTLWPSPTKASPNCVEGVPVSSRRVKCGTLYFLLGLRFSLFIACAASDSMLGRLTLLYDL